MILGLSLTHLIRGTAKFVQHPQREKIYWVHMLWVFYIFLLLIHFWWWEYKLTTLKDWSFPVYFFVIGYIMLYFVLCALLYPDDVKEYQGYEGYFYSRKKWFYGVLAASFVADIIDTLIKGKEYFLHFGLEYPIRNITHLALCLVAIRVSNKKYHAFLAVIFIVYELSYILRLFFRE